MIVAIDGPAGSGKSTVARGRRAAARLHLPGLGRDVPGGHAARRSRAGADLDDGAALGRLAAEAQIELRERDHDYVQVLLDGRDVSEEIRDSAR